MPKVCFYFLLHQPYRLTDFSVLDLDNQEQYFAKNDDDQNRAVFLKIAEKSYRPMLSLLLDLVKHHPEFKFSFSVSGVFLEQAKAWASDVLELLVTLSQYPQQVEILGENYYHSLAALYSKAEFAHQVRLHEQLMKEVFGVKPKIFRNTELIYDNQIAKQVARLGYLGMLTEAVEPYLAGQRSTQVWCSNGDLKESLPLLLKQARLSDDIAFRFSQRSWSEWPLRAEKYLSWLKNYGDEEIIGLFMDFETFGEHQWESTGIFAFFKALIEQSLAPGKKSDRVRFVVPSDELALEGKRREAWLLDLPIYDVTRPISWADENRDLSAWRSNVLQEDTLRKIYALEEKLVKVADQKLLTDWRRLQTSDHFYYMCTKYFADGDVHAYFSAYDSPLEAYRRYCVVLADLTERCRCQST